MTITIEAGVAKIADLLYVYRWNDVGGIHEVTFTSDEVPKVGDSIENGVLVPLVGYKINDDHSKWLPDQYDYWPDYVETDTLKK